MCLSCGADVVEKQWDSRTIECELLLLELRKEPGIYAL
jgi:hypothetical protein